MTAMRKCHQARLAKYQKVTVFCRELMIMHGLRLLSGDHQTSDAPILLRGWAHSTSSPSHSFYYLHPVLTHRLNTWSAVVVAWLG